MSMRIGTFVMLYAMDCSKRVFTVSPCGENIPFMSSEESSFAHAANTTARIIYRILFFILFIFHFSFFIKTYT